MKSTYKFILLICLILFGCDHKKQRSYEDYNKFLNELSDQPLLAENKFIFIIPNAGCSGCIMESERFMLNNIDHLDSAVFILTTFNSVRDIRAKYSQFHSNILDNRKVILDQRNILAKFHLNSIYPMVILANKGKILKVEALDPDHISLLTEQQQ